MLYDAQRWDRHPQTHTATPSLPGLIAWLEAQDPATRYDWMDIRDCLMCRYGRAIGLDFRNAGGHYWTIDIHTQIEWPDGFTQIGALGEQTYGAALIRARALLVTI